MKQKVYIKCFTLLTSKQGCLSQPVGMTNLQNTLSYYATELIELPGLETCAGKWPLYATMDVLSYVVLIK